LSPRRLAIFVKAFTAMNACLSRPGVARAFALRPRLRHALFRAGMDDPSVLDARLAAELVPRLAAPGFVDALLAAAGLAGTIDGGAIATPALLIWGSRDPILPVAAARDLAQRMPNATLEVLDVGHSPMIESVDTFNRLVGEFVASRAASGAQ
jgi:pimeloyl-ACP methyl ester carboxylesterase